MRKRRVLTLLTGLLCLCFLAGCIPQKYDPKKKAEIEAEGRKLLEAYAASLPGGEITDLYMLSGYEEGGSPYTGSYLSNLVRAKIKTANRDVKAIINIKSGELYTDIYMQDVDEAVKRQLQPYLDRAGIRAENLRVKGAEIYTIVISPGMDTIHKNGAKVDSLVAFSGMIPSDITETDMDKWAETVLKNAKLSAFTVSFETDTSEFPGVSFLKEFLSETGNYRIPDENVFSGLTTYRISASVKDGSDTLGWSVDASLNDTPEDMEFSVFMRSRKTEGPFTFLYNGATGYVPAGANEPVLTENDCPVTVDGDTLHYYGSNGTVRMIFAEKPQYTAFERVTYQDGKPKEPEELILQQLPDGTWSLTNGMKTHEDGYVFMEPQDIRCR